jgi:hypothetical protein
MTTAFRCTRNACGDDPPLGCPHCAPDHYDRAEARGRIAAQAVRARGENELEAALAQIRATFDEELRADTMAALKLSATIANGRVPTMEEVADVLKPKENAS